jgi:4-hydroxy-2-oxoheptanedioate aldolase
MRPSRVRTLLAGGGTAVNGWLSGDSSYLAESLSHAGFDAITVDVQHGMFGLGTALHLIQAIDAGPAEPFARCSSHDPAEIGKLLDAGVYGLICPSIDTPDQAAALVEACRYPPAGQRSYGPARAALHHDGPDYAAEADDAVLIWAMIESREALEAVHEIASVPGLDGLFVGPNDLALALGARPGLSTPPAEVEQAWTTILHAAHGAGLFAGTFCPDGAVAARLTRLGYDLVTPGSDAGLLLAAATAAVGLIREPSPG